MLGLPAAYGGMVMECDRCDKPMREIYLGTQVPVQLPHKKRAEVFIGVRSACRGCYVNLCLDCGPLVLREAGVTIPRSKPLRKKTSRR